MNNRTPQFVHFRELHWPDINCDLHLHTTRTDGRCDIETVVARARELKLARIAFTEHVRRETDWFGEFAAAVRAAQGRYQDLEILVGCEAKALDTRGSLDVSEQILAQCEIVLGSVHRFPNGQGGYVDFASLSPDQLAGIECDLALGLLQAAPIQVLAHPGGMYARRFGEFPRPLMKKILESSLQRGVAVEISTSYVRELTTFLDLCEEVNPYVSVGSDMHQLKDLGYCRDRLLEHGIGRP